MDPRLYEYFDRELLHLREMGAEFAAEFPKIASRLGMEGTEVADPYVERLLEGFAFLAARVHLRLDAQFPRFTQHLLEMVYPHYLCPMPSMAIVQLQPSLLEAALADGFPIPSGSVLRSPLGKGDVAPCKYRTAHEVRLFPLEIVEAEYTTYSRDLADAQERGVRDVKGALRLRLRTTAGATFDAIALDSLVVYLKGVGEVPMRLYEQVHGNSLGVLVRPARRPAPWSEVLPRSSIRRVGFGDHEAALPYGRRSFQGYRLLQEYFAFPERFLFVEVAGLREPLRRSKETEIDVIVLLGRTDAALLNVVDASNFALNCTPVVNLFPMRCDNIHLTSKTSEYHVLPDRTSPMDFEVHQITSVVGTGTANEPDREFSPFYAITERSGDAAGRAYYTVRREPRLLSETQRRTGNRAAYLGSEVFVALADAEAAPYSTDLQQLAVEALCTNRDLPLILTIGHGRSDFSLQISAPVEAVRCLAGPTAPRPSLAEGEAAWRFISQLSLNYLSLVDDEAGKSAAALREILALHAGKADTAVLKQIEGLRSVATQPVIRRIKIPGPITFGRGLEITLTLDETAFRGSGVFLLGAVLDEFFARYVSINAFTETVVSTLERGEIMRWPTRAGRSPAL